jgi:hypothetical protein
MLRAQNNMQAILDRVAEWYKENGFRISQEKTKAMRICRVRSKPEIYSDPTIRLNGQILEVVNKERILGLILDKQLTWRPTHRNGESKMQQETEPFEASSGSPMGGADQSTLLRVLKMLVLLAVELESAAYGTARKKQLKKLDPIHNKGCVLPWELSVETEPKPY